ncbi:glycosyltransferase family 4 protein [Rubrivirga sp.]|uniref:glycosyltransferase family 4 protein n=1 Tax=Rubrivirga sp. TaxID=1885344 RepID=UPI003C7800AF
MIPVPPTLYGGIERIIDMLARGLEGRGHRVTLFAHRDSQTAGELVPYAGERPGHPVDLARNTISIARLVATRPDVVHSFGRLATLLPLLPTSIPKVMSYQREPTLSQVRRAVQLSRQDTMAFTGCAEHIAAKMRPVAPSYAVFNGVPLDTYTFQAHVEDDAPLAFLGRIERIKGTHTAIEVAEQSGRRLVIAGNVSDEAYFEAEVRPRLSDRIEYVGPVDDVQKNELLGRSLAFLMPIEWEEPFGIVMAEALACGTPIVGTPRGSVLEVVLEGETGFVRETVGEMAQAVGRVSTLDRAACRADCEARFSDRAIVDAYEALYHERIAAARAT